MNVLVTGCAGFIGSHTSEEILKRGHVVYGIDSMSYAADVKKIEKLKRFENFHFYECYINDAARVKEIVEISKITHVINFAAETHVDNSIRDVSPFIYSNVHGVANLIEVARSTGAHIVQISTDEVYGVPNPGEVFSEASPLCPRNPYSATKAAADHLILAAINTHGISAHIIRPSNNFGPGQHGEKFIPTILRSIKCGHKIPVYGDGKQRREWTYVKDTSCSIVDFLEKSHKFTDVIYNLTSEEQMTNIEVINAVCKILRKEAKDFVDFVEDRPGHDREYRISNSILSKKTPFVDALLETAEII